MKLLALSLLALLPVAGFAKAEKYIVSPADTKITWEGKKRIGDNHSGELKLKSGTLEMNNGKLTGGEFEIDMTALKVTDIQDAAMNKKLDTHLRSEDFFSIEKFPVSKLKITKAEKQSDGSYKLSGDLTIKGIPKPLKPFTAQVEPGKGTLRAVATIPVDRTLYNIRYNSLKFFSKIGDKAIEDEFTVSVDLRAKN